MKRRCLLLTALASVGLSAASVFVVVSATAPRHGVTRENAKRVQVGMHRSEIERCLGGPPGNYSRDNAVAIYGYKLLDGKEWVGDDCAVLWFDRDGNATRCEVTSVHRRYGSLERWTRWMLGRY